MFLFVVKVVYFTAKLARADKPKNVIWSKNNRMSRFESPVRSGQEQGLRSPAEGKGWAAGGRLPCLPQPALGLLHRKPDF